jgi:hypothetical protein
MAEEARAFREATDKQYSDLVNGRITLSELIAANLPKPGATATMPDARTHPEEFRAWAKEHANALQLEALDATGYVRSHVAAQIELVHLARTFLWANAMPGWSALTPDHPDYASYTADAEAALDWAIQSGAIGADLGARYR